jgi:transposase InsO family protein
MSGETGCLTCGIATIRSRARKKEAHTGAKRAGEYLLIDIQHSILTTGLTIATSYAFYLLIVDAYSRYVKLYGLPKKSTSAVVAALQEYQADQSPTGSYGYLNTERIRADARSQFTGVEFADYCIQHGIKLSLAAPKKQYQNHLAERTWQTVTSTARLLLIHSRLPDTFWYLALVYSTYIFNALPVRGLSGDHPDVPSTPHELFFGTKPRIHHLRVFGCSVRKWTSFDRSNGKQTERGIRGIFLGLDTHQKGYVIYSPGSRTIIISDDVLFDEQFSSAIAHTWQKFQDGLALTPLASFIPDMTTHVEQMGTFHDVLALVEEGEDETDLLDLKTPYLTNGPPTPSATSHDTDHEADDLPDVVPQTRDVDSTAEYDDDASDVNDDEESLADDEFTSYLF